MAEYTPKSWVAVGEYVYEGPDLLPVAEVHKPPLVETARFIAAAPDMEEALEAVDSYTTRMLEMHPGAEVDESWWAVEKQIRAALAKARGM